MDIRVNGIYADRLRVSLTRSAVYCMFNVGSILTRSFFSVFFQNFPEISGGKIPKFRENTERKQKKKLLVKIDPYQCSDVDIRIAGELAYH